MSEIGKTLKSARIEKGYTLDDLQQITKIQKKYLIAIEEENFAALPGVFYVRAFIKQYAETVGLNPAELLSQLKSQEQPVETVEEPKTRTAATKKDLQRTDRFNHFLNLLPTIIIVAVVVIILGSIYFVAWNNHQKNSSTQEIQSSKVSVSSSSVKSQKKSANSATKKSSQTSSSSAKQSSTNKKSAKQKTSQKIQLTSNSGQSFVYELTTAKKQISKVKLTASAKAWSAISIDGSQQWQGTLTAGESHELSLPADATKLSFNLGNSKATSITINRKKFNFLKDNSTLTVRTLTVNIQSQD